MITFAAWRPALLDRLTGPSLRNGLVVDKRAGGGDEESGRTLFLLREIKFMIGWSVARGRVMGRCLSIVAAGALGTSGNAFGQGAKTAARLQLARAGGELETGERGFTPRGGPAG